MPVAASRVAPLPNLSVSLSWERTLLLPRYYCFDPRPPASASVRIASKNIPIFVPPGTCPCPCPCLALILAPTTSCSHNPAPPLARPWLQPPAVLTT